MNEQTRRTFIRAGLIAGASVFGGARLFGTAEEKESDHGTRETFPSSTQLPCKMFNRVCDLLLRETCFLHSC
jgi:hypothetical protein